MAGIIRNLKNPFTGNYIFPVTKTRAIFNDDGTRLDNYLSELQSKVDELQAQVNKMKSK